MRNDSHGIAMGGTSGSPVPFYPIPLHDKEGRPNLTMIAAYVAINDRTVNIADAYTEEGFDFSGTRNFDKRIHYSFECAQAHHLLGYPSKHRQDTADTGPG